MKWSDWMPWSSFFECWVLSQLFHSPLSLSSRGSSVPLCFLPYGWCHLHIWDYWRISQQSWFQLVLHPAWPFAWCTLQYSCMYVLLLLSHFSHVQLCNPIDGSPHPWDSPGKNTGVGCHFLLQCVKVSRVWLLATPRTAAYQAPPSRQEYWSGVPLPSVCKYVRAGI